MAKRGRPTSKSNRNLEFIRDSKKSYVHIKDRNKDIGMLCWHYTKQKWVFEDWQGRKREIDNV